MYYREPSSFLFALAIGFAVIAYFFHRRRDVAWKQRWFPWLVGLVAASVGAYSVYRGVPPSMVLLFAPLVAFVIWVRARQVRFCEKCGGMVDLVKMGRPRFCPACGAELRTQ